MKPTRKRGTRSSRLVGHPMHTKRQRDIFYWFNPLRRSAGQSMVELALLLPVLVLIIVGVFDLGRAFHALITITNAAREGARYGTLHPSNETLIKAAAAAEAAGSGIIIDPTTDVQVNCPRDVAGKCIRHNALTVTVTYTFESLFNMFIPATIDMQRSIQMAIQ